MLNHAISWGVKDGYNIVVTDGGESDTVLSGKAYASVAATEALSVYGELSFAGGIDDADTGMALSSVLPGPSETKVL